MFDFTSPGQTGNRRKTVILPGFLVLLLMHAIFVFAGFYNNDDINYSRLAAALADHNFSSAPSSDQYQLRWTIIYVTAVFYKLFGINAFTSLLCSFISMAACGLLLKRITRQYPPFIFFLTLALFFFAHSILFYMHRLLPDPVLCLAALWMYLSYRLFRVEQRYVLRYGLQFSVAFLLAIVSKETIIIVLPLFAVFFLTDVVRRRWRFWSVVVPVVLVLVFLYLLYFKLTTGSFFYRYQVLLAKSYSSICSFDTLPLIFTLKRIGYELWRAMLLNGDLLILLPALVSFIYQNKLKRYVPVRGIDFTAFMVLLLSANFMTISFTSYVPLCHDPRHFLFLFPFASVIAAPLIYAYGKDPDKFVLLPLALLVATITSFYLGAGNVKFLYLGFTVILLLPILLNRIGISRLTPHLFIVGVIILFFSNYCIDYVKPPYPYYEAHRKIVERNFKDKEVPATIISSDDFSSEMTEYFLQFNTGQLTVQPVSAALSANTGPTYFLLVSYFNSAAKTNMDSLMKVNTSPEVQLVDQEAGVLLYRVNKELLNVLK